MPTVPPEYRSFLNNLKRRCKYNGIKLILSPSDSVLVDEFDKCHSGGYWYEATKTLAVATSKPIERWFPILVHESCHMDQWLSNDPRIASWDKACLDFFEWLDSGKMLNRTQLNNVVKLMIELELDCERRAVEKIRKAGLPINISEYIRKANTYLYSYTLIPDYKIWPSNIYYDKELVKQAPKVFKSNYFTYMPEMFKKELVRHFESVKAKKKE